LFALEIILFIWQCRFRQLMNFKTCNEKLIVSTGKSREEKEENETERTFSQNFLYKSRGSFKVITDQTRLN
jgi:hypothetical protein